jgi:VWFA-related protein
MLLLSGGLLAQQADRPKQDEIPIFRAGVTLVKVDVEVTGRGNTDISDFTQQDFRIFDENEPREIAHFSRESEPLDLLLLLDVSGSMRQSLADVAATTRAALANLHAGDRVALMLFSRRTEVIQPFTEDLGNTQHKILDSIYKQNLGSGTLINESLIAAADYMKKQPVKGRRAMLIVTDNEGLNYKSPDAEVVKSMYAADTVLNALIVRKDPKAPALRPSGYTNPDFAPPDVSKIASQTGGLAVERVGKVSEVFEKIIERIRSRYFIQYAAPPAEPGAFRHIRVELAPAARSRHPEAVIRARDGYFATASQ